MHDTLTPTPAAISRRSRDREASLTRLLRIRYVIVKHPLRICYITAIESPEPRPSSWRLTPSSEISSTSEAAWARLSISSSAALEHTPRPSLSSVHGGCRPRGFTALLEEALAPEGATGMVAQSVNASTATNRFNLLDDDSSRDHSVVE